MVLLFSLPFAGEELLDLNVVLFVWFENSVKMKLFRHIKFCLGITMKNER